MTFDNDKDFSEYQRITEASINTYFADSYRSNQRARNKNTNGLSRQYLPKLTLFNHILHKDIEQIQSASNNRSRKSLGWFTLTEIMTGSIPSHLGL